MSDDNGTDPVNKLWVLDLVTGSARAAELRTALVLSRGLMGCNAALVLRAAPEGDS